jgi:hypothetical protein
VSFVGNHIDSCHPACFVIHQWLELAVDGFFHHPVYRLDGIPMLYGQTLITFIMDKSNISYSRNKQ